MVKQYPHTIKLTVLTDSTQNTENEWEDGESETEEIPCRAEPNSTNGFINGADGSQVRYDWTVYFPLPVDTIEPGTQVEIFSAGCNSMGKGTVKRFSAGQLNARAWI